LSVSLAIFAYNNLKILNRTLLYFVLAISVNFFETQCPLKSRKL
jgi:hypothetical protein